MTVRIKCPNCGKELSAPDELIGKKAMCPRCRMRFPVARPGDASAAAPPEASAAAPTEASSQSDARGEGGESEAETAQPSADLGEDCVSRRQEEQKSSSRVVHRARFIAGDASAASVELGADGQLPQLILQEKGGADAIDDQESQTQSLRPLILVGAFCLSLLASVAMLLVDPQMGPTDTEARASARKQLEEYYTGKQGPDSAAEEPAIEPYQRLLRRALQAHNRGDYGGERRLYRQVLDMLHAEGKNEFAGLTGLISGPEPDMRDRQGNDEHLEQLLSSLIAAG